MNAQPLQPDDSEALVLHLSAEVMARLNAKAEEAGQTVFEAAAELIELGLEASTESDQEYQEAMKRALALMDSGWKSGGRLYSSRDELYER